MGDQNLIAIVAKLGFKNMKFQDAVTMPIAPVANIGRGPAVPALTYA
jgi:hypothetical protein